MSPLARTAMIWRTKEINYDKIGGYLSSRELEAKEGTLRRRRNIISGSDEQERSRAWGIYGGMARFIARLRLRVEGEEKETSLARAKSYI